jgi:hypothetical protein
MPYPVLACKVAFTGGRFDTPPAYTTLPIADLRGFNSEVGRKSDLDKVNPGSLAVDLFNDGRLYDPTNTAGAHYGQLTPGRRVQFTATYDATNGTTAITYVAAGAVAVASNASVAPALPAGWAVGDLLVVMASIRNSGTGTVNVPTGWTALVTSGNVSILGRIAQSGDTAPTITFAGGVANATTMAQCFAWRGTDPDVTNVLHASAVQLNGSAQNIAYPVLTVTQAGCAVVACGWKQDDWTSVAQLAGMTEISDSPTLTGDDAGQTVDYVIQPVAANIGSGSFTVTGGASAISRGIVFALKPYRGVTYQLFNGWTDGWPTRFSKRLGEATMKASGPFRLLSRTVIASDPYREAVLADAPTGYYRLNETAGNVLADSSGNGLHGVWVGDLDEVTTGGLTKASDGAIKLPPPSVWRTGRLPAAACPSLQPVSVECWIKLDQVPKALAGAEFAIFLRGGILMDVYCDTRPEGPGVIHFQLDDTLVFGRSIDSPYFWSIADGNAHHIVATYDNSDVVYLYIDGTDRAQDWNGTPAPTSTVNTAFIEVNGQGLWDSSGAILDEVAFYDYALTGAQVNGHLAAGSLPWYNDLTGERFGRILDLIDWPAGLRDIDNGQSHLGSATWDANSTKALDYLELVADTEQGLLYEAHADDGKVRFQDRGARQTDTRSATAQAFFSDNTTDLAGTAVAYSSIDLATDDHPAANVVTVKWRGGQAVATDASAVDLYGEITTTVDTLLEHAEEAEGLAAFVLAQQSALFTRVRSITVRPANMKGAVADRAWVACLSLQEGDRVRVKHLPTWSGVSIDQQLWILGIEHHAAKGVEEWETTYHLGPVISTAYWILGTSQLGTTTRLSY